MHGLLAQTWITILLLFNVEDEANGSDCMLVWEQWDHQYYHYTMEIKQLNQERNVLTYMGKNSIDKYYKIKSDFVLN